MSVDADATARPTYDTESKALMTRSFSRRLPVFANVPLRTMMGLCVMLVAAALVSSTQGGGHAGILAVPVFVAWLPGVLLADKYVHKYPQRYVTYLLAAHAKAAVISVVVLGVVGFFATHAASLSGLWQAFALGIIVDALLSVPSRGDRAAAIPGRSGDAVAVGSPEASKEHERVAVDTAGILGHLPVNLDPGQAAFLKAHLPPSSGGAAHVLSVGRGEAPTASGESPATGLVISAERFNDIRRLNQFLLACGDRLPMGGYLTGRYVSHDTLKKELKERYPSWLSWPVGLAHFLWGRAFPKVPGLNRLYFLLTNGKNRVFSKVEIWGRLSYCGMRILAEAPAGRETFLLAQRVALPVSNRRPSYYPIVALEKVGLDGELLRTHKLRSMFPFSEFLQKQIFEDQGLAATGKFANEYRLTEYGAFVRKYWLDELPQIFDWIRGDVKLVGMRATSRHYLSLYPKELYDLYIQTKPGLIPPIFDESTPGFAGIVAVELTYLKRYWESPFRTDARYLLQTFSDIFLRGVRSK